MAGKITEMTAMATQVALSDLFEITSDPGGSPLTRKETFSESGGALSPLYSTGRLTLVTGNATPNTDQTAKGTIYFTSLTNDGTITANPFHITIFDGTRLRLYSSAEISLAVTLTAAKNYDVFIYDNAGTLTLELSAAWTNDTARADALAAQSGHIVKSGVATRRWIGTIAASGTNTTEDSTINRFVWNAYNQVFREFYKSDSSSHSYDGGYRSWNNSTTNRVSFISGRTDHTIIANVAGEVSAATGRYGITALGFDSTSALYRATANYSQVTIATSSTLAAIGVSGVAPSQLGRHFFQTIQQTVSLGSCTFSTYTITGGMWA